MELAPVLIDGTWRTADAETSFTAENPATQRKLATAFPISKWADCDAALDAAATAALTLRNLPPEQIAAFLEAYASNIELAAQELVGSAHEETGLPASPRLRDVELPRTTNQLRQAAAAAREESWKRATLDLERNIRSCFAPIGPVVVFGPNNFPFAFNGISGGDFAAAIAAGNPVIAKAHPLHPNTSRLLAEEARKAMQETAIPSGTAQMLYHLRNEDGLRLVSDPRVGATGFTGSRTGGLHLREAADDAGKPIYLEMSSINPVIFMPGALEEDGERLAKELTDSCLAGSGQFCTSPNLILLWRGADADKFIAQIARSFTERAPQPLLSADGLQHMQAGVAALSSAGAKLVTGGSKSDAVGYRFNNTLLTATGELFLSKPSDLQREVFGNATMIVTVDGTEQLVQILHLLEGNLTGSIYSGKSPADQEIYENVAPVLRQKVGRLLNDRMPTGVAVSPAMNHGGPYPATAHSGFTSVGIPTSMTRFASLQCYDGVRQDRLPAILRDQITNTRAWRSIDGSWVRG